MIDIHSLRSILISFKRDGERTDRWTYKQINRWMNGNYKDFSTLMEGVKKKKKTNINLK